MASKPHPQQGFKACLGILRLGKSFPERIERACARALHFRTFTYASVASILRHNLDQVPLPGDEAQPSLPLHENVRGGGYCGRSSWLMESRPDWMRSIGGVHGVGAAA